MRKSLRLWDAESELTLAEARLQETLERIKIRQKNLREAEEALRGLEEKRKSFNFFRRIFPPDSYFANKRIFTSRQEFESEALEGFLLDKKSLEKRIPDLRKKVDEIKRKEVKTMQELETQLIAEVAERIRQGLAEYRRSRGAIAKALGVDSTQWILNILEAAEKAIGLLKQEAEKELQKKKTEKEN